MKKMRKNNKGFSLVELIVVVLIMAIIAVALAPQIMKWVGHSRTSTDAQTYDTLFENIQLALTDAAALAEAKNLTADLTFTISNSNTTVATYAANSKIKESLDKICGSGWESKVKSKESGKSYVITIKNGTNGTVERTTAPATDGVN